MNYLSCRYCNWLGSRSDFEFDHSYPALKTNSFLRDLLGGKLELICSGCNRQKGDKTPQEYVNWRFVNREKANFGPIRATTFLDILRQRAYSSR